MNDIEQNIIKSFGLVREDIDKLDFKILALQREIELLKEHNKIITKELMLLQRNLIDLKFQGLSRNRL